MWRTEGSHRGRLYNFTVECAQDEVEFYMGMMAEEDQSFKGLIDHLHDAFQLGETLSELISDFYGWSQKARETEDTFADDLQVLTRKIIVHKPSFRKEANQQLKAQYAHKLWDQYYAAMAHRTLQSSPKQESFTRFWGHLVAMFGGCTRQSQSSASSAATSNIESEVNLVRGTEDKLSKNSRWQQNKINQQKAQIKSLQTQTQQLQGLLEPKSLVSAISKAVSTSLKLGSQPNIKGGIDVKGTGFVSKPYLGKPRPSQLAPSTNRSLNLELECWYCKDTGHLKDNCIKLNCQLANEQNNNNKMAN